MKRVFETAECEEVGNSIFLAKVKVKNTFVECHKN